MARQTIDETGAEVVPARAGALQTYTLDQVQDMATAMLDTVPDAVDDDGAGIIARLIEADGWEDLNSESKLPNGQDLVGVMQVLRAISKRPSDLGGEDETTGIKLPYYLMVDSVRSGLGTELRWQTSAPALVVPIIKLFAWGKLPATVEITKADKPTKRGFYPLGLRVHAVNA